MKKMTAKAAEELRKAFLVYRGSGMPEEALVQALATHTIGLLEICDDHPEWFEGRCRFRWVPGILRDPESPNPTEHARCALPAGHPLDPAALHGGHIWGADDWPEYPGGKPPKRRKKQHVPLPPEEKKKPEPYKPWDPCGHNDDGNDYG